MGSFLKTAFVLRRIKNVSHHFVNDELHGLREFGEVMQKILPPIRVTSQKHSTHCDDSSLTIVMHPMKMHVHFGSIRNFLKFSPNPSDTNDTGDKSDARTQRDEEVKNLQDLRQRTIDHNFHQESVWKALQERDDMFRRKDDKDTKSDDDKDDK